ncbi:50S ribosomal protein L11 methyltransferase [Fructilactobacillus myrtifloralis]|uniref:Ribosomal protein L11 methyltransferase n=1 Tax=Fructilactobacillus myrtifloralis TaxID=2940301 RepID=A0ABY5BNZ0_9LACO|nr:50S ribosomal protein L11 methyltransferase [Fructilactobacillus myrtifloralis]USS85409.1 50S ribosomal protein L11 methyltransferase [Fructilactobacillus myrtifloralis]
MSLTKVQVTTTNEAVAAVSNLLVELGAQGIQIEDQLPGDQVVVETYVDAEADVQPLLGHIQHALAQFADYGLDAGAATVTTQPVDDRWTTEWEQYYHAERITRYLTVVPNWEDYQQNQRDQQLIRLDPGMAFGTGTHPTTKLALQALEMSLRGGETLFDVGTGSGVLSIGARLLGAGAIRAFDNDPVAVASAQQNVAANPGMQDIEVATNSLLDGILGTADVIVANMLAEVLHALLPQVPSHLAETGQLILSGIYADQLAGILAQLDSLNLDVRLTLAHENWRALVVERKGQ